MSICILVVGDNKVLISEVVNIRHFPLELQLGKLPRLTLKLHLHKHYFISMLMKFMHTKYIRFHMMHSIICYGSENYNGINT